MNRWLWLLVALGAAMLGYVVGIQWPPRPGVAELTIKECTSLGGVVGTDSAECTNKGQFTCRTVDIQGREHVACIDEITQSHPSPESK